MQRTLWLWQGKLDTKSLLKFNKYLLRFQNYKSYDAASNIIQTHCGKTNCRILLWNRKTASMINLKLPSLAHLTLCVHIQKMGTLLGSSIYELHQFFFQVLDPSFSHFTTFLRWYIINYSSFLILNPPPLLNVVTSYVDPLLLLYYKKKVWSKNLRYVYRHLHRLRNWVGTIIRDFIALWKKWSKKSDVFIDNKRLTWHVIHVVSKL